MSTSDVTPAPDFDLERYLGTWFEIGRLPLHFEENSTNITATYSLNPDGTVAVDNRCFASDGEPKQALGQATQNRDNPAQLRVTFLPSGWRWFPGTKVNYWVLSIDDDYRYALVGTPDRRHLWLLAREAHITPEVEAVYLTVARHQGFDISEWIRTPQDGAQVTDEQLAN